MSQSYFTISEFELSETAIEHGWDNHIPTNLLPNIRKLIEVLTPIRIHFDEPLRISSGYRMPWLNKEVGGATSSRHLLGLACDFRVDGFSVEETFEEIITNFDKHHYRTLIQEKNRWCHLDIGQNAIARNFRYAGKQYVFDRRYKQKETKVRMCKC